MPVKRRLWWSRAAIAGSFLTVLALTLLFDIGCVQTGRGYAAKQWALALREMQIVPVFPPREDIQVGDIYLIYGKDPSIAELEKAKDQFLPISEWVGRIDLRTDLDALYGSRTSLPATDLTVQDFTRAKQPTAGPGKSVFQNTDITRLRLVGFPEFLSATYSEGNLSALIPTEAVEVGLAGGFTRSKQVRVSVPVAEYCGLPTPEVQAKVDATKLKTWGERLLSAVKAPNGSAPAAGTVLGSARVITEVYYTRVIDVSVFDSRSRGGALSVKSLTDLGVPAAKTPTTKPAAGQPAPATQPASPPTPQSLAADMNRQLDASMAGLMPGGSVKFVSAGVGSVSLRRTFERPMAIGVRGLLYSIGVGANGDVEVGAAQAMSDVFIPISDRAKAPAAAGSLGRTRQPTSQPDNK